MIKKNIVLLLQGFDLNKLREANAITMLHLAKMISKKHTCSIVSNSSDLSRLHEESEGVNIYKGFISERQGKSTFFVLFKSIINSIKKLRELNNLNKLDIIISVSSNNLMLLKVLIPKLFFLRKTKIYHIFKSRSDSYSPRISYNLCNLYDGIIVQTQTLKEQLIKNGVKEKKITIINSHIDTDKFIPILNTEKLKKKYACVGKKNILYYGHFNKFKGIEYLIKSIKHIKTENIQVILIPSGDHKMHIYDDIIQNEGVGDKISITKSSVNIVDYVNLADLVVLPYPDLTSTESNPSCILESLACKTPVVTTNLTELREIFKDEVNLLMAEPKNEIDLANKIDQLFNNSKIRDNIVLSGFKLSKKFSIDYIYKKYEKTLNI